MCFTCYRAVDPGVVETNIMREVPSGLSHLAFMVLRLLGLLQSPENGVKSIVDATLAPPVSLLFPVTCLVKVLNLGQFGCEPGLKFLRCDADKITKVRETKEKN